LVCFFFLFFGYVQYIVAKWAKFVDNVATLHPCMLHGVLGEVD